MRLLTARRGAGARLRSRRFEAEVLLLQITLALTFVTGAVAGWFPVDEQLRAAVVAYLLAYHGLLAVYGLRFRLQGDILPWFERAKPIFDLTCVTAGWLSLGDPASPFWAVFLYALFAYSRRVDGRGYLLLASGIVATLAAGQALVDLRDDGSIGWGRLSVMVVLAVTVAALGKTSADEYRRTAEQLEQAAQTDALTGLWNRRTLLERLEQLGSDQSRPFAVVMLDLDDFKVLNDRLGHLAGDQVLRRVAELLRRGTRPEDLVARYGGEEFVIAIPDADERTARAVADRIRTTILASTPTTSSFGIAIRAPGEAPISVLRRADEMLLRAKRLGKNTVVSERSLARSA